MSEPPNRGKRLKEVVSATERVRQFLTTLLDGPHTWERPVSWSTSDIRSPRVRPRTRHASKGHVGGRGVPTEIAHSDGKGHVEPRPAGLRNCLSVAKLSAVP